MVKYKTGMKRSEVKPRYDKIPWQALQTLAQRFTLGGKYDDPKERNRLGGKQNWHLMNAEAATDAFNHAFEHLIRWVSGDRSDDHLGAAIWGICVLIWATKRGIIK